ncbi:MAG: rhodanese-like domain-containing protein [Defluviitaleaceae bacterium]|nr:rhodanese-like domain-containing protein [Defluviitaleaceae bacterium]
MKKKWLTLPCALMAALMVAGCASAPPPPPAPAQEAPVEAPAEEPAVEEPGAEEPAEQEQAALDVPVFISVDELSELVDSGDENLVLVGVINPTQALIPFTDASNPIFGSYLVWVPDYMRSGTDEALSPNVDIFRRPVNEMEDLLSRAGITPDSQIVVYHSDAAAQSGRVTWHLRALGLNARFLDGGNSAWRSAGGRTGGSQRMSDSAPQSSLNAPNTDFSNYDVTIEQMIYAVQNPNEWVVIDVRSLEEFNGERAGASAMAYGTGRIANTVHLEWTNTIDPGTDLIRPEAELRQMFDFIGDRRAIVF